MIHVLSYYLPATLTLMRMTMIYSPRVHGASPLTFNDCLAKNDNTLIVIRDTTGHIFGAYCTEQWRTAHSNNFYGSGDSFVWTFHLGEELRTWGSTNQDDFF